MQPPALKTLFNLPAEYYRTLDPAIVDLIIRVPCGPPRDLRNEKDVVNMIDIAEKDPEVQRGYVFLKLIIERLGWADAPCVASAGFMGAVLNGIETPGQAVIVAHSIASAYARWQQPLTVKFLLTKLLDGNVVGKRAHSYLWDRQKIDAVVRRLNPDLGTDNWLDVKAAWSPAALKASYAPVEAV